MFEQADEKPPIWRPTISLGNVLTIAGGLFALAMQWNMSAKLDTEQDGRIDVNSTKIANLQERIEREAELNKQQWGDVKDSLRRIETKLDAKQDK